MSIGLRIKTLKPGEEFLFPDEYNGDPGVKRAVEAGQLQIGKVEYQPVSRPESKLEPKPEQKLELKLEPKPEPKPEPKSQTKPKKDVATEGSKDKA